MKTRRATYTVVTMMALCLAGIIATDAIAKPESMITGIMNAFKGRGLVLEARRPFKASYFDVVLYQNGKIVMFRCPDKKGSIPQTPLHSWNMDKIKALTAGGDKAVNQILTMPSLQRVHPVIRAVTLRENTEGNLEFLVSNYGADGPYRKTFPIDATTWKLIGDDKQGIQIDNPCADPWSVEQKQGTLDAPAAGEAGAPAASSSAPAAEKPGFGSAAPKQEQKSAGKAAAKGAGKAGKSGKAREATEEL